jgi:hypothetical protein
MIHMRSSIAAVLLLVVTLPSHALTLDDVRRSLAEFRGASALNVRIDSQHVRNDGKKKTASNGSAIAEDDGMMLRLVHDKKALRQQLTKSQSDRTDFNVDASDVLDLMNYGPKLLKTLEGATLKSAKTTTLDGVPVTLVEIVPVREKDEDGDKYVKNYVDTLLLWLGPGSVPIAAERTTKIKARVVVIGFELLRKEKLRFMRSGDRLLVAKRNEESSGSGLGQSENETKSSSLSIVR